MNIADKLKAFLKGTASGYTPDTNTKPKNPPRGTIVHEGRIKKTLNDAPKTRRPKAPKSQKAPKAKKVKKPILSPKETATANGEPYIDVLKVNVDPKDLGNGSFELDWNDKFILNLIKQGYKFSQEDTEAEIVDRWFQTVCRNIALEIYEQEQADPDKRDKPDVRIIQQKDLGNGRTEVS